MDIEIPGSFIDTTNTSMELNTPIKKIKNLTINSPGNTSSIYPNLDDISSPSNIMSSMLNKGYSQKITNNVLNELNLRANEISELIKSPPTHNNDNNNGSNTTTSRRNKRYSGLHRSRFNKMESISNHYSVSRINTTDNTANNKSSNIPFKLTAHNITLNTNYHNNQPNNIYTHKHSSSYSQQHNLINQPLFSRTENIKETTSTENDIGKRNSAIEISSAIKRRRTLNGPEEVLNQQPISSPIKQMSSPIKKISPSKKSMNLNKLLNEGDKENFLKPYPLSNRIRMTSLEMAGVKSNVHYNNTIANQQSSHEIPPIPQLHKKSSIPQLQNKSSIPQLQKKSSIPNLQRKASNYQLNKQPSSSQLTKKLSSSNLQRQSSSLNLEKKPSLSQLQNPVSVKLTLNKKSSTPQLQKKPSISSLALRSTKPISNSISSKTISSSVSSRTVTNPAPSRTTPSSSTINSLSSSKLTGSSSSRTLHSSSSKNLHNYTKPQPFSLYEKPTISSSQKSLSKFQRFKQKFN